MRHFVENTHLECGECFPIRGRQSWKGGQPFPRMFRMQLLNLFPAQTFPIAEMDFAQCWLWYLWDVSAARNLMCGADCSAQVARVDRNEGVMENSLGEIGKLCATRVVDIRIGMAAISTHHRSLCVTNESDQAHYVQTPHR